MVTFIPLKLFNKGYGINLQAYVWDTCDGTEAPIQRISVQIHPVGKIHLLYIWLEFLEAVVLFPLTLSHKVPLKHLV